MNDYKEYFTTVNSIDILFGLIFCISILILTPKFLPQRVFFHDKITSLILQANIFLYFAIIFLDYLCDFLPNFPDASLYFSLLEGDVESPSIGVETYFYIYSPISIFFNHNIFIYSAINSLLYIGSALLLWEAWKKARVHGSEITESILLEMRLYFLMILLWPSALLHIPIPLREPPFLFFWSASIWAIFCQKSIATFSLFATMTILLRPQLGPLVFSILLISKIYSQNRSKVTKIIAITTTTVIGFAIFSIVQDKFDLFGNIFSLERMVQVRNANIEGIPDYTYNKVEWVSWLDVLLSSPKLIENFMLGPINVPAEALSKKGFSVDAIFILVLLLGAIVVFKNVIFQRYQQPQLTAWLLAFVISTIMLSVYEFSAGGAPRHRMPNVMLLMPIASLGLSRILSYTIPKRRKFI